MRQESTTAPSAASGTGARNPATEAEHFLAGLHASSNAPSLLAGRQRVEDEGVRRAMVRHLEAHSRTTERLSVGIALALCVGLQGLFPNRIVLPWMSLVVLAISVRAWVRWRLRSTDAPPDRFLSAFRLSLVPVGLAWAVGPLMMMGTMTMDQIAVVLVLHAGICAAATASLAPDRRSFTLFSISLMGGACIAIAWGGWSATNRALIGLSVLFTIAMYVLATRGGASLAAAVRSQEALRDSQRKNQAERALLDTLIRCAPMSIVAVDRGGLVLGVNPAFEALFGWGREDIIGRALVEVLVSTETGEKASELLDRVFAGQVVTEDLERLHRSGRKIPVRVSAARSDDALLEAAFVLYEDRTTEIRAYQAIQRAEEHYRDLVESSSDLVWKIDITGRWTFLNAASTEIYGVPPAELLGTGFGDRVEDERREADLGALLSVFQGHALTDYETVHKAVDGTLRSLSFNGRPIRDASSCVIGAQGTARDVSERAAIRDALENARELALHNANDKTSFLANMSHEIRTPMNAVIGMIEILLSSELDSEQRRHGEVIRSSAGALLTVIDDILDFSRLESDNLQLEAIPFGVRALAESTIRLMDVQAQKKGLVLEYSVDQAVPDRVVGDPGRIRQILMNLIGNAIKFTHVGSVTVDVRVGVDPDDPDLARLRFSVSDTGIGVPPDKIEAIFDHFTQADASTTRRYGGTGLGLAICKGFVAAMHGDIGAESDLGIGSEFSFWIPMVLGPDAPSDAPGTPRFTGTRVLVVDANAEDRSDVERLLLPLGVSLTCVGNAQEALEKISGAGDRPSYDVVLLDRNVSGMDGFDLAGRIRTDTDGSVPIIMLSSEPRIGEGARCRSLGISGYLPKPVSRGDLLEVVGRVISRDEAVDTRDGLVTRHSIAEVRQSLHILLVEDNPLNQEVASALLERRGHTVDVVDCGTEAVSTVVGNTYDVVLMDIQLPGIDGVEATRRIRATAKGADLPIVALTAHAFGEERARAMDAGMNDFLTKPFRPHELFAVVEGWLPAPKRDDSSDTESAHNDPPVDVAAFRQEMREVGIESIVDESLALFQATAPERIELIVGACAQGDLTTAAREAHGLKSAAGTIHATQLHSTLDAIEDGANAGDTELLLSLGRQVGDESRRALEYLKSELSPAGVS